MSSPNPPEILLHKHTRREFRERMQQGELRACIIPIAATEQHLEHLAMEHDWRSCSHVAEAVARQLSPRVVVTPALNIGISEHHMQHIGTLSASPGSFLAILFDTVSSMQRAGFTNILVLNGHGGNTAACEGSWSQFLLRTKINLHFKSYWEFLDPAEAKKHLSTGRYPGHAQEFETAFALAAFPENVRADAMGDQADQEPAAATAEAGTALINSIVNGVSRFVAGMMDGSVGADIPDFR